MDAHATYVLRLGDNALVLGQRLSEWCGHSPFLEEDVALANTALDLIGRARMLLTHAGELENKGRGEDDLAFHRDEGQFVNYLICELPIGDFAFTMLRQYLLDAYHLILFDRLQTSGDETLAAIAAKATKEAAYHARRSGDWVLKLGDGTEESHQRAQSALDELWAYTPELFREDDVDRAMLEQGIGVSLPDTETDWRAAVETHLSNATLRLPEDDVWTASGGREGRHTEHLGRMLAEMQVLPRRHPDAAW